MVGSQLANESVHQRGLTDTGLTCNQQVSLGLTTQYLINHGNLFLKTDHVVQVTGTRNRRLVNTILGKAALSTSSGCGRVLRQFCAFHIGSLHIGATGHLCTDVRRSQRQCLQLIESEAYTWCHQ